MGYPPPPPPPDQLRLGPLCTTSGNSGPSTRQTPEIGPSTHRNLFSSQHSTATSPTPTSVAVVVTPSSTVHVMGTPDIGGPSTLTTGVSAGVGGILLIVCVLVAVTVIVAVAHARRKRRRREEGKKADVPVLQVPPPINPREGISSPR